MNKIYRYKSYIVEEIAVIKNKDSNSLTKSKVMVRPDLTLKYFNKVIYTNIKFLYIYKCQLELIPEYNTHINKFKKLGNTKK